MAKQSQAFNLGGETKGRGGLLGRVQERLRNRRNKAQQITQPDKASTTINPNDAPNAIGPNPQQGPKQLVIEQATGASAPQNIDYSKLPNAGIQQPVRTQPVAQQTTQQPVERPMRERIGMQPQEENITDQQITAVAGQGRGITLPFVQGQQAVLQTLQEQQEANKLARQKGTEPITLGKDQSIVRLNPETGEYERVSVGGMGTGGAIEVSPQISAFAKAVREGQAKLSDIPQDVRGQVLAEVQKPKTELTQQDKLKLNQAEIISDNVEDAMENAGFLAMGLTGAIGSLFPGSKRNKLNAAIDTLSSAISRDTLQAMRDASPTGGALGQVSERELDLLSAALGSLDKNQGTERLREQLNTVARHYNNWRDTVLGFDPYGTVQELPNGTRYKETPEGDFALYDPENRVSVFEQEDFNQVGGDTNTASNLNQAMNKIASVESEGNYQALGPTVQSGPYAGERALGKYQIMPGNLPAWSREALGYEVTPEQFLENPEVQEAITADRMQKIYNQYGDWEDVASVWFTGRPATEGKLARDVTGTTGEEYIRRFRQA